MARPVVRRSLITGIVVGLAAVHLSVVGLVVKINDTDLISQVVGTGAIIPVLLAFVGGYRAGGPIRVGRSERSSPPVALAGGALAGLAGGLVLALFAIFVDVVQPSGMLINATPKLVDVLYWGQGAALGIPINLVGGAAVGLLAAGVRILPSALRRGALTAIIAFLSLALLQTFVSQVLTNGLPLEGLNRFLYARHGMTVPGTIVTLAVFAAGGSLWSGAVGGVSQRVSALPSSGQRTARLGAGTAGLLVLLSLPLFIGSFLAQSLDTIGIYILLGLGLNIVVGFAGLLDLGYVAFYAVGAYATAVLTSPASPAFTPTLNFWIAVPLVMAITALIGVSIGAPVLRLRGDYLAIVTLGFGEIARLIFQSDWTTPLVGGAQGIQSVPDPSIFGLVLNQPEQLYYPILLTCILAALAATSLANSRVGRAWTAMREDESVAEATGINTTKYKLMAFAMGATFGGLGGAFYAVNIGNVFPQALNVVVSINVLALIILGGVGSIRGVLVGAVVLVGLPEILREFAEFRLLIYGAVLVAMMLLRPEGLLPNRARRAELHESEPEEGQWHDETGTPTPEPEVTA